MKTILTALLLLVLASTAFADPFGHPLDRPDAWIDATELTSSLGVASKLQHDREWSTRFALSEVFYRRDHEYASLTADVTWSYDLDAWQGEQRKSAWLSTLFLRATFELAAPLNANVSYAGHTAAALGVAVDGVLEDGDNFGASIYATVGKTTNGPFWVLLASRIQFPWGISYSLGLEWSAFNDNHNTLRIRSAWQVIDWRILQEGPWRLTMRVSQTDPFGKDRPGIRIESAVHVILELRFR